MTRYRVDLTEPQIRALLEAADRLERDLDAHAADRHDRGRLEAIRHARRRLEERRRRLRR